MFDSGIVTLCCPGDLVESPNTRVHHVITIATPKLYLNSQVLYPLSYTIETIMRRVQPVGVMMMMLPLFPCNNTV